MFAQCNDGVNVTIALTLPLLLTKRHEGEVVRWFAEVECCDTLLYIDMEVLGNLSRTTSSTTERNTHLQIFVLSVIDKLVCHLIDDTESRAYCNAI